MNSQDDGLLGSLASHLFGSNSRQRNLIKARSNLLGYWNDLAKRAYEDDYNSPLEMSRREAMAGINSNIAGIGDVEPTVGDAEAAFDTPLESPVSDVSALSAFNPILQIAQSFLSLHKSFSEIRNLDTQNASNSIGNLAAIADFGRAAAIDSIQPADFDSYKANKETFLDSVLVQASSLAENYFGEDYPNFRTARKVFQNAFNQHRSSVFANSKSWDEFSKMRSSQLDSSMTDYDMENGITRASLNLQLLRSQVDAKYARLEAELLSNPDYTTLWNDERFASIRADIESAHATEMEQGFNAEVWNQVNGTDGASSDAASAIAQEFKAKIQEYILRQKDAELKTADVMVIQAFNDYLMAHGAFKTNNAYDAGSKWRTQYRGASARYGAYVEYLPVTLDDVMDLMKGSSGALINAANSGKK